jgi:cytochrome c-type biogenesis protein CcmF
MAIIVPTSFPIINKLFGTSLVIGEDKEFPYNRIQIFVAVVIGILTAIGQYLKYKNTAKAYFLKKLLWATVVSLLASVSISYFGHINYDKYGIGYLAAIHLALFASVYAVIANAAYIYTGLNGKWKAAGASVAHFGFALMMVGILISSSKKEVLSVNTFNPLNFGPERPKEGFENLTLFRGVKTDMGKYWATYEKDSVSENGKTTWFKVNMERKDGGDKFTLYPDLIKNTKGQEGMSNNPDSRHYWHKDIFSYVNHASSVQEGADTAQFKNHVVKTGDTVYYSEGFMVLDSVTVNPNDGKHKFSSKDTAIMANLSVYTKEQQKLSVKPVFYVRNNSAQLITDTLYSEGLAVNLTRVADDKHLEISVKESSRLAPFLALKVLQFPFINLVWLGTILMIVGFVMSMVRRVKMLK